MLNIVRQIEGSISSYLPTLVTLGQLFHFQISTEIGKQFSFSKCWTTVRNARIERSSNYFYIFHTWQVILRAFPMFDPHSPLLSFIHHLEGLRIHGCNFILNYRASSYTDKEMAMEFITALAGATYRTFDQIPEFHEIKKEEYMSVVLKYAFKFEPSVSNSGASGTGYRLERTITEMGVCYSFNSQLAVYSTLE